MISRPAKPDKPMGHAAGGDASWPSDMRNLRRAMRDAASGCEPQAKEDYLPTRRSLLSRLRDLDNQESWREFFELYWRFIYGVALRSGLTEDDAQDVVQEVVITVSNKIGSFRYDPAKGRFKHWLQRVTQYWIQEHSRRRRRRQGIEQPWPNPGQKQARAESVSPEEVAGPLEHESVWEREWRQHLFAAGLQRLRGEIKPRHYQVFDLYVLRSWPLLKVARALRINPAQVYVIKSRVCRRLKREIELLETRGV